ncbi:MULTISPECIES: hypothetical protein [Larsenimonas]|uniref:Uncharacterized protein n=1 Tax=Larsenimonas suaedae TaxID=1851019 RepID=A0ABU1GVA9_9GAMM|nr:MULTISPECIES: hypothetical protein [Larsenimonas]MCM2971056.1 hypothetical protein [Larsenimonas suaedae]MCM5703162.1 hypothetical protein [Larsenimonas salina]MDR5895765.1 hypothetical protein [Larsenimonas suaedae]
MSSATEIQQQRMITELRHFIKKMLQEPEILSQSLIIAREHYGEPEAMAKIANAISNSTNINIPENPKQHSPADGLFLDVLKEVVEEERAMY